MAIAAGADALGLVGEMPSGPGVIADDVISKIAGIIPPPIGSFLLTSRKTAAGIIDHARLCGVNTVQVVRHIDPQEYPALVSALPAVRIAQVIHIEDESALQLIDLYEPYVHAFLLDSGRPSAATAELGGTGRSHDWSVSAEFVRRSSKPVFLAGGLGPANVAAAIQAVRPYGLDLCSGVRTNGNLDQVKLSAFVANAAAADR